MNTPKLVDTDAELCANTIKFHAEAVLLAGQKTKTTSAIANGCSHAVEWVACQKDDGTWAVAFCKYAGYNGLTFPLYDKLRKTDLTGTDTKRRVQKLGGVDHNVGKDAGPKSSHPAVAAVEALCALLGKSVKRTAKVRVFTAPKRPATMDVLVAAISAAKLSTAEMKQLFLEVGAPA